MATRILAVDDEASVTRMIKLNLEAGGGYEVLTANDGREALATARQSKPDLILLDVMMPDMDGGEVAAAIETDPLLKSIPIVYLTAAITKQEVGTSGKFSGGRRVIAKPISADDLITAIEEALQQSRRG